MSPPGLLGLTIAVLAMVVVALGLVLAILLRERHHWQAAADQARVAKNQLVDNLGHEVASPLNAILTGTDVLLSDRSLSAEVRRQASVIRAAACELELVSFNTLALHADATTHIAQAPAVVTVPDLLADVCETVRPLLDSASVRLNTYCEFGGPYQIEVAESLLRLAVLNVVAHAARVTSAGTIDVTIHGSGDSVTGDSGDLRVTVTDTGQEVPPNLRSELFVPWGGGSQLNWGVRTGLNLYVARKLARRLGGDVTHGQHPHAGNLYEIVVPAKMLSANVAGEVVENVVVAIDDAFADHRRRVASQRVLVTEDQRSNAYLLVGILRRAGHVVEIAATGEDALRRLEEDAFTICVMDLRLPTINGIEVMQAYRTTHKRDTVGPDFIVLTGEFTEHVRQKCIEVGAKAFLMKPISAERLLASIDAVVTRRDSDARAPVARKDAGARAMPSARMRVEYLRNAHTYVEQIKQALATSELDTARQCCRALGGLAHLLSADNLAGACRLMRMASDDDLLATHREWGNRLEEAVYSAEGKCASPDG